MDTVVVGAGPVGCFAGLHAGADVILEEHPGISEKACGGLFSRRGIDSLGVYSRRYVLNRVKAAKFFSPKSGFEVRAKGTKAYAVDRQRFDRHIAGMAERSGCEMRFNSKVSRLRRNNGRYEIVLESGERLRPGNIILACGASNFLLGQLGLSYPPHDLVSTVQYEFPFWEKQDFVELHFSREFAPNFFAWKIPAGESVRVGVGVRGSALPAVRHLDVFLKRQRIFSRPMKRVSAPIPLYRCCGRVWKDNVLLAGDAAAQVKPTTGGGIIPGMAAARIAGKVLSEGMPNEAYGKLCSGALSRELQLGLLLRRVSDRFSDRDFDRVFDSIRETGLDRYIAEHGDMDRPSSLFGTGLLKMPLAVSRLFADFARACAGF